MKKRIGNFVLEGWTPTPVEQALMDGTFEQMLNESEEFDNEKMPSDFLEVQDFDTAVEEIKQEIDNDYERTHELVPLVENLLKNNFSQRDIEIFLAVECSDDMKIGEVAEKYNVSVERVRQIRQNVRKMLQMGEDPHGSNYA